MSPGASRRPTMPDAWISRATTRSRGLRCRDRVVAYGSVFPKTIKQIQAMGQVTRSVTPTAWVHARRRIEILFRSGPEQTHSKRDRERNQAEQDHVAQLEFAKSSRYDDQAHHDPVNPDQHPG